MGRRKKKTQLQKQIALKEDRTRGRQLLASDVPGAKLLGQLLSEHGPERPYWSAASAVSVFQSKPAALERIKNFRSLAEYIAATFVPSTGEKSIIHFSAKDVEALERTFRKALRSSGICTQYPGLFAFDFEFDSSRRMVIVHLHGLLHWQDSLKLERLSSLKAFKSRPSCKYPIRRSKKGHANGIGGFVDYMVKSYWTDRPSYQSPNSGYLKRGLPRRIRNPEQAMFLVALDNLKPEDLVFRVGGGSGRH